MVDFSGQKRAAAALLEGYAITIATQTSTFEKLAGEIEANETYIGGKVRNMHVEQKRKRGRGTGGVGKAIVMGLLKRHGIHVTTKTEPPPSLGRRSPSVNPVKGRGLTGFYTRDNGTL